MVFSLNLNANEKQTAVLVTTAGVIELELFPDIAPLTVENFTTHIKNGMKKN